MAVKKPKPRVRRQHLFLSERGIKGAFLVVRLDGWSLHAHIRGQFYPNEGYPPEGARIGAIWRTEEKAAASATFAAKTYCDKYPGRQYGVFKLTQIIEQAAPPSTVTKVL